MFTGMLVSSVLVSLVLKCVLGVSQSRLAQIPQRYLKVSDWRSMEAVLFKCGRDVRCMCLSLAVSCVLRARLQMLWSLNRSQSRVSCGVGGSLTVQENLSW